MYSGVYVTALGASTPVGRDARATAAAVRASITGFEEHPYMLDTAGEPMRVAMAPWLDVECEGADRFAELLLPALAEALEPIEAIGPTVMRVALALALPIPRRGLPETLERDLRLRIEMAFPDRFAAIGVFPHGHAAGFVAMRAACDRIDGGMFDASVVAGVESYLARATLEWLEETNQLHGAGVLNNAWGFIPGEGAGAVLLMGETIEDVGLEPLARVLSVGIGFEQNRIKTDTVCIGEGLTTAFREGIAALPPGSQITDVFCDMNGEPYRADEFGFACLRTKEAFVSVSDFVAPAENWGDVSAASAPLQAVLSGIAAQKAYANGPFAFLWASSESGERGTLLLQLPFDSEE